MQAYKKDRTAGDQVMFSISQVAALTGVNAKAIRYYESTGVLPRPSRSDNHYRRYNLADINRLILLRCLRLVGIPLHTAKPLLSDTSDARCIDVNQKLLALIHERLKAIDQELVELQSLRTELESYQHRLSDCHPDEDEFFHSCHDMSCIALQNESGKESALCQSLFSTKRAIAPAASVLAAAGAVGAVGAAETSACC